MPDNPEHQELNDPEPGGSVIVVEMSGAETDGQIEELAWQMFCNAHPIEAFQHDPARFRKSLPEKPPPTNG